MSRRGVARRLATLAERTEEVRMLWPLVEAERRGERLTAERVLRQLGPRRALALGGRLFSQDEFALPGSLHAAYRRCGRSNCRCAQGGRPHGPYLVLRWRDRGRHRAAHVSRRLEAAVRAAVARWQQGHPDGRRARHAAA